MLQCMLYWFSGANVTKTGAIPASTSAGQKKIHWSITSFVTSFVTSKVFVMHYELRNHYEALVMLSNDY